MLYVRKNDYINLLKHYDEVNKLIQVLKGMAVCGRLGKVGSKLSCQ